MRKAIKTLSFEGYVVAISVAVFTAVALFAAIPSLVPQVFASTSTSTGQTINLTVNQTITLTVPAAVSMTALTPGNNTPSISTTTAVVSTNASNGWNLQINRNSSTSTLASSTINFPDYTSWNGSSNAATSSVVAQTFAFRVYQTGTTGGIYNTTWWGTNDTDPNAKFGGVPTGATTMASTSTYSGSSQTVVFGFRADAPATQAATNYTGNITVTAIALP